MTIPLNGNGHRRRQLRKRVLAEETHCALCDTPVDKTLKNTPGGHGPKCPGPHCPGCQPHPMRAEVDEDIPRAQGGSPHQRNNCHLLHRKCNQFKGNRTLKQARALWQAKQQPHKITPSPIW